MRVFTFGRRPKISSIGRDNFFEASFFPGAEMRAGMQDDEGQAQLVCPHEFLGQSAQRVGVKLRVGRRQVDEVIGVCENRRQLSPLRVLDGMP